MQKYEVQNIHRTKVKCMKWSQNAMKLYSGDDNGVINCTEFDYDKVK